MPRYIVTGTVTLIKSEGERVNGQVEARDEDDAIEKVVAIVSRKNPGWDIEWDDGNLAATELTDET